MKFLLNTLSYTLYYLAVFAALAGLVCLAAFGGLVLLEQAAGPDAVPALLWQLGGSFLLAVSAGCGWSAACDHRD